MNEEERLKAQKIVDELEVVIKCTASAYWDYVALYNALYAIGRLMIDLQTRAVKS